jgi:hypothetical protein
MSFSTAMQRGAIGVLGLALACFLAIAGQANAKKKPYHPKPLTVTSKQTAAIPAGTAPTFDGSGNQLTPFVDGKAQTTIRVPNKKNFPIKSVEVSAIVAPTSPAAHTIGVGLRLTGPTGASTFLNTPFFTPPGSSGFGSPNDPGSPAGVGYGVGTNCAGSPMKFTNASQLNPASEFPSSAFDDPGFAEFTTSPPYTAPVFTNLNSVYKGLNSKGVWKLTANNSFRFGESATANAADTSTLVCWSLTVKPQKLPKGQSA